MCRRTRVGFTLVELLIVIALIGLLLALALPTLRRAREHALREICSGQLHQLNVAVAMYSEATEQRPIASRMPSISPAPVEGDTPIFVADVLQGYVDVETRIFHCPKDTPGWSEREAPNTGKSYFESERSSYFLDRVFEGYERFHLGETCRDPNPPYTGWW